jgi:hypothetical protein
MPGRPVTVMFYGAYPVTQGHAYRWDFNVPGLPKEFQVLEGSLTNVPGAGPDKSGCLEARDAVVRIDVPPVEFPLLMRYDAAGVNPRPGGGLTTSGHWLPCRSGVQFFGVSWIPGERLSGNARTSRWFGYTNYYSGSWISRWNKSYFHDLAIVPMESDGRVTLMLRPDVLIDNLVIQGISTNDLPDMRKYLDAFNRIPVEKRRGIVPLPELKVGPGVANASSVFVKIFTNCNERGLGTLEE